MAKSYARGQDRYTRLIGGTVSFDASQTPTVDGTGISVLRVNTGTFRLLVEDRGAENIAITVSPVYTGATTSGTYGVVVRSSVDSDDSVGTAGRGYVEVSTTSGTAVVDPGSSLGIMYSGYYRIEV